MFEKRTRRKLKRLLAELLICAILTGLVPASLPQTVHVAAAETKEEVSWYEISARINSAWGGNIAGEITLKNTSDETVQGWQIAFPWDAKINSMWGAVYEKTENGYLISPMEYNLDLSIGGSVTIGFLAEGEDSVLEELTAEGFFQREGIHITSAEERKNMPPEPSREAAPTTEPESTVTPIVMPTITPTGMPEVTPTVTPMLEPTATPAVTPTIVPTVEPTATPTVTPTVEPTATPTIVPTVEPTVTPTVEPTATPTIIPTVEPTVSPTVTPTIVPTVEPTATPTVTPEPIGDLYIYTDTTLTEDVSCNNLFLMGGDLTVTGCTVAVQGDYMQNNGNCTLQSGQISVQGNAHITSGSLAASGQSIFRTDGNLDFSADSEDCVFRDSEVLAGGDYIFHAGYHDYYNSRLQVGKMLQCNGYGLCFYDSELQVNQDVCFTKGEFGLYDSSVAALDGDVLMGGFGRMDVSGDESSPDIRIDGDLLLDSQIISYLWNGKMLLGGDIIQTESAVLNSLWMGEDFVTEFCGDRPQKIQAVSSVNCHLGTLDLRNSVSVEIPDTIYVYRIIGFDKIPRKETLTLYMYAETLEQDETIYCDNLVFGKTSYLTLGHCRLEVQGNADFQTLQVEAGSDSSVAIAGNCSSRGKFSLYDSKLQIGGNFQCNSSFRHACFLQNSSLEVDGSLYLEQGELWLASGADAGIKGSAYVAQNGWITVNGKSQYQELKILGDLRIDSEQTSCLQNGRLILGGDLIQTENASKNSLTVGDSFTMKFRSIKGQKIKLADHTTELGILDFRESAEIDIQDEIHGTNIIGFDRIEKKEKLELYLSQGILYQDETITSDNVIWHEYNLDIQLCRLTVQGNLDFRGKMISGDVNTRNPVQLIIKGNFNCASKEFSLFYADTEVKGNFRCFSDKFSTDCANLSVGQDCFCSSLLTEICMDLIVGGNLTIDKGEFRLIHGSDLYLTGNMLVADRGYIYIEPPTVGFNSNVNISGDLVLDSAEKTRFSYVRLTLGGDFLQTENSAEDSLEIGEETNIRFNGKEEQTISLKNEKTTFGCLDFSECASLYYDGEFYGESLFGIQNINSADQVVSHCKRNIVTGDGTISGDFYCDGYLGNSTGASLTVEGDFYNTGGVGCYSGAINVTGDYTTDAGSIYIYRSSLTINGDMHIKGDNKLDMFDPDARLNVRGNLTISAEPTEKSRMTDGIIEVGGNVICSEYSSPENFKLAGTKLILDGDELQRVQMQYDDNDYTVEEIDMTRSAGVLFNSYLLHVKSIKGFENIKNTEILIKGLKQELDRDEVFHGELGISDGTLNLAGHSMEITGNLKLYNTVLNLNTGVLTTDGNYSMYGTSVLLMVDTLDRLNVKGNFRTASTLSHYNCLRKGRISIGKNFRQSGNTDSFACTQDLLVAFMGDDTHYYWFEGKNYFEDITGQICCMIGEPVKQDIDFEVDTQYIDAICLGIQDGIKEMAENPVGLIQEAAMGAALGLGISVAAPAVGTVAGVTGIAFSVYVLYQNCLKLQAMDDNCERLRELARMVTVTLVESLAEGAASKLGHTAAEVSANIQSLIKDAKLWTSTCDWLKKNVVNKASDFVSNVKNLLNRDTVNAFLAGICGGVTLTIYTYLYQTIPDIFADLSHLIDGDALSHLKAQFSIHSYECRRLLLDVKDCISMACAALGRTLKWNEVKYTLGAVYDHVPEEKINRVIRLFQDNTIPSSLDEDAYKYLKELFEKEDSSIAMEKVLDVVDFAAANGKSVDLGQAKYIVRALNMKVELEKIQGVIKKGIDASVKELIDGIPRKYKRINKCDAFAKRLKQALDGLGIEHKIILVLSESGFVYSNKFGESIGDNNFHYGILVDNTIYDNMTPEGWLYDKWKEDLGVGDNVKFAVMSLVDTVKTFKEAERTIRNFRDSINK